MKYSRLDALKILAGGVLLGLATDYLLRQPTFGLNYLLLSTTWLVICLASAVKRRRLTRHAVIYSALAFVSSLLIFLRASGVVQFWMFVVSAVSLFQLSSSIFVDNYLLAPLLNRWRAGWKGFTSNTFGALPKLGGIFGAKTDKSKLPRGAIIAASLVIIFLILFSSADQVFGQAFGWLSNIMTAIKDFFGNFDIFRIYTIAFWSACSVVALLTLLSRLQAKTEAIELKQNLSLKESKTILWSLIIVFSIFVILQLSYLFGHSSLPAGLTYAGYARSGYGQLLIATMLTGAVIKYTVSASVKKDKSLRLSALALLVLNSLIVVSAYKRLSLYEGAYGWTMTRFTARLGLLCIVLGSLALALWIGNKFSSRQFYASCWYIVAVVLIMAAILNPEALVAKQNIAGRKTRETALDSAYLAQLSNDTLPTICREVASLKANYPKDYEELTKYVQRKSKFIPTEFNFKHYTNHGVSRHYTQTLGYQAKYKSCFWPN